MAKRVNLLCQLLFFVSACAPAWALSLDGLDEQEKAQLHSTVKALDPFIERRKEQGTAPLITYEELYAQLAPGQRAFADSLRQVDPAQTTGSNRKLPASDPGTRFVRLDTQVVLKEGKPVLLDTQFLPLEAYEAYRRMMAAMERDLGKRLLVESGYRSPAYQLYLFLFYMPKHAYSVRETNRHVALPGCSEHGSPDFQAFDFITPEGVNGEDRPEEFEELQEYGWLHARAREFGFFLSYPRPSTELAPDSIGGSGQGASAFEPWHWHYEANRGA